MLDAATRAFDQSLHQITVNKNAATRDLNSFFIFCHSPPYSIMSLGCSVVDDVEQVASLPPRDHLGTVAITDIL